MIADSARLGVGVAIPPPPLVNLYGCSIENGARIGTFVEIQINAVVGARCETSSHPFICEGVTIEDEVFAGHGVMFINDRVPRATAGGTPQAESDWVVIPTRICRGTSVGSGAVMRCGVAVGCDAVVGAGAVVARDVPAGAVAAGVPARLLRSLLP